MLLLLLRIKVVKMERYNLHVTNEGRNRMSEGERVVIEIQALPIKVKIYSKIKMDKLCFVLFCLVCVCVCPVMLVQ